MRAFETKHQHTAFEERLASAAAQSEPVKPSRKQQAFIRDQIRRLPRQERAFYKAVLGALDAWGRRLEQAALSVIPEPPPFLAEAKGAREDLLGDRILKMAPSAEVREHLEQVAMDNYASIHNETIEGLNATMGLAIDPSDALSARVMAEGGRRMGLVDLDKKAKKKLFKILEESRLIGEGPEVIARRIREHIPAGPWRTTKIRSRVIARTETLHAQRVSQLEVAAKARVRKVMIFDDRLGYGDEICAGLNGSVVSIGDAQALMSAEHPNGTRSFAPHYDPKDQPHPSEPVEREYAERPHVTEKFTADERRFARSLDSAWFNAGKRSHLDKDEFLRRYDSWDDRELHAAVHDKHPDFQNAVAGGPIHEYTGEGLNKAMLMNSSLRAGKDLTDDMIRLNKRLHEELRPLSQDSILFRGENYSIRERYPLKVGDVTDSPAWTSTTLSAKYADAPLVGKPGGRIWEIKAPEGTKAIVTNPEEAEVILPPNARLRITAIENVDLPDLPDVERVIAEVVDADAAAKAIDDVVHSVDEATYLVGKADEAEAYAAKLKGELDDLIGRRNDARTVMNNLTGDDKVKAKREYLRINTKVQKARKLHEAGAAEAAEARKLADDTAELARKATQPPISEEVANLLQLADEVDARVVTARNELEDAIRLRDEARRQMNAATPAEKPDYKREYLRRNTSVQKVRKTLAAAEEEATQARRLADEAAGAPPGGAPKVGDPDWTRGALGDAEDPFVLASEGREGWKFPKDLHPGSQTYLSGMPGYETFTAKLRAGKPLSAAEKDILRDMIADARPQSAYQGYRGLRLKPGEIPAVGDELDLLSPTSTSTSRDISVFFATDKPPPDTIGVLYRVDVADGVEQIRAANAMDEIVVMPGHRMQITGVTKLEEPLRRGAVEINYAIDAKIVKIPSDATPKPPAKPKPPEKLKPHVHREVAGDTLEDLKDSYQRPDADHYASLDGLTAAQKRNYDKTVEQIMREHDQKVAKLLRKESFVADADSVYWDVPDGDLPKLQIDPRTKLNARQKFTIDQAETEMTPQMRHSLHRRGVKVDWDYRGEGSAAYDHQFGMLSLSKSKGDVRLVLHEATHGIDANLSQAGAPGRAYAANLSGSRLAVLREGMDTERKLREAARHARLGKTVNDEVTDGFTRPVWAQYETRRYEVGRTSLARSRTIEYQTVNSEGLTTIRAADNMLAKIADDAPLTDVDRDIRRRVAHMSNGAVQDIGPSRAQWRKSYLDWRSKKMAEWERESPAVKRFVEAMHGKPASAVDDVVEQQAKIDMARDTARAAGGREAAARATREAAEGDAVRAAARATREIADAEKRALGKAVDRAEKQVSKAARAKAAADKAGERAAARAAAADKAKETAAKNRQIHRLDLAVFTDADRTARELQTTIDDLLEKLAKDRGLQKQHADDIARLERETRPKRIGLPEDVNGVKTVQPGTDRYNIDDYLMADGVFGRLRGYQRHRDLPSGVHDYHGNTYYKRFQKALREEQRLTARLKKIDDDLQRSMKDAPEDRLVWRGESYASKTDPRYEKLAAMEPGEFLDDKQYMSTSTNMTTSMNSVFGKLSYAHEETVAFQVHVRKGSRTIIANSGEREYLLSRGEKLRVLSKPKVKKIRWGSRDYEALHIDLEVLPAAGVDDASQKFNQLRQARIDLAASERRIAAVEGHRSAMDLDLAKARKKADAAKKRSDAASARADASDKRFDDAIARSRQASEQAESAVEAAVLAEADSVGLAQDAARIRGRVQVLEDRAARAARGEFPTDAEIAKARKGVDSANNRAAKAAEKAKKLKLRAEELERIAAAPDTDTLKGIKGAADVRKARRDAVQARKAADNAQRNADEAVELADRAQKEADELYAAIPSVDELKPPEGIIAKDPLDYGSGWTRKGPQAGSNPDGLFENAEGERWYLKFMDNKHREANEIAAADLYRAAGIDVPDVRRFVSEDVDTGVASRIQKVEKQTGSQLKNLEGAREGFVVDAWLANWDVVGLSYDNMLKGPGGKALRLDTGGALLYRAQGSRKGHLFGNTVGELDTLRNASMNRSAASVFGDITDEQLIAGAKKVAMVTEDKIDEIVRLRFGNNADARALASTLKERRKFILDKFPAAKTAMAEEAADAARIAKEIADAQADTAKNLRTRADVAGDSARTAAKVADEADDAAEGALRKALDDTAEVARDARRVADDADASAMQAFRRAGETEELAKAPVVTTKPVKPKKPPEPKPQPVDPRLNEGQKDFVKHLDGDVDGTVAKTHAELPDFNTSPSVMDYVLGEESYALTEAMRKGQKLRGDLAALNKGMDEALAPLSRDMRVFRGEPLRADLDTLRIGEVYEPKGWSSTSTAGSVGRKYAEGGRVWDIQVPKGQKAVVTNPLQAEVILPPNTRLRIVRIDKWDDSLPGPKLYNERVIADVVDADTGKVIDDAARTTKPLADQAKIAKQAENHVDQLQANLDEAIRLRDEARAAKQGALDPAAAQREYLRKNRDVQKARKLLEAGRGEASDARKAKTAADDITATAKPRPVDPRLAETGEEFFDVLSASQWDDVAMAAHKARPDFQNVGRDNPLWQYVYGAPGKGASDSEKLNRSLRRTGRPPKQLKEMHQGLFVYVRPLEADARILRGEPFKVIADRPVKPGDIASSSEWTSTSGAGGTARFYATHDGTNPAAQAGRVWDIRAPKGAKAIVTNELEHEFILPPNTKLRVLRVDKWDDSLTAAKYGSKDGREWNERVIAEIVDADTASKAVDDIVHSIDEATHLAQRVDEAEAYLKKTLNDLDGAIAARDEARAAMNAASAADKPALKKEYLRKNRDVQKARKLSEAAQAEATDRRVQAGATPAPKLDAWTDVNRRLDDANTRLADAENAENLAREAYRQAAAGREFPLKYPEVRGPYSDLQAAQSATEDVRRQIRDLAQERRTMAPLTDQADAPEWMRSPAANGDAAKKIAQDLAKDGKDGWVLPDDVRPGTASVYVSGKRTVDYGPFGKALREGRELTADQAAAIRDMVADAAPQPAFQGYRGVRLKKGEIPKAGDELDIMAPTSTSRSREVGVDYASYDHAENVGLTDTVGVLYRLDVGDDVRQIRLAHVIDETIVMPGHRMQITGVTKLDKPTLDGIEYAVDAKIVRVADASKVETAVDAASDAARKAKHADDAAKLPAKVQEAEKYSDKLQADLDKAIAARDEARAAMNAAPAADKPALKKEYLRKNRDVQKARKLLEAGRGEASDARKAKAVDDMATSSTPKPKPTPEPKPVPEPKPQTVPDTDVDTLESLKESYSRPNVNRYASQDKLTAAQKKEYKRVTAQIMRDHDERIDDLLREENFVSDADSIFWNTPDDKSPGFKYNGPKLTKMQRRAVDVAESEISVQAMHHLHRKGVRVNGTLKSRKKLGEYDINTGVVMLNQHPSAGTAIHELTHALDATMTSSLRPGVPYSRKIAGTRLAVLREGMETERKLREAARHARLGKRAGDPVSDGFSHPVWHQYETRRYQVKTKQGVVSRSPEYITINSEGLMAIRAADDMLAKAAAGKKLSDVAEHDIRARVRRMSNKAFSDEVFDDKSRAAWEKSYRKWRDKKMAEWERESPAVKRFVEALHGKPAAVADAVPKGLADEIIPPADPRLVESADDFVRVMRDEDIAASIRYGHQDIDGFFEDPWAKSGPGKSLAKYTDASNDLNGALRGQQYFSPELKQMNQDMQSLVREVSDDMRLFRGETGVKLGQLEVGSVVEPNAGWTSTSRSSWTAAKFSIDRDFDEVGRMWDIRAPKGTKAIITNPREAEVILPPGARLKIVRIDKWDDSILGEKVYQERVIAEIVPADTAAKLADDVVHSVDEATYLVQRADEADRYLKKTVDELDKAIAARDEARAAMNAATGDAKVQAKREYLRKNRDVQKARRTSEAAQAEATDRRVQANASSPSAPPPDPRLADDQATTVSRSLDYDLHKKMQADHAGVAGFREYDEGTSVWEYTDGGYHDLNPALRNGGELSDDLRKINADMQQALVRTDGEMRVFRGDAIRAGDSLEPGGIVTPDAGWMSTSRSAFTARGFADRHVGTPLGGRAWDIRVPKGQKAIITNATEAEVILPPNTQLRILRIDKWDDGVDIPGKPYGVGDYKERVIAEIVPADTAARAKIVDAPPVAAGSADAAKLRKAADDAEKHAAKLLDDLADAEAAELAARGTTDFSTYKWLRDDVARLRKQVDAARAEAAEAHARVTAAAARSDVTPTAVADAVDAPAPQTADARLAENPEDLVREMRKPQREGLWEQYADEASIQRHGRIPTLDAGDGFVDEYIENSSFLNEALRKGDLNDAFRTQNEKLLGRLQPLQDELRVFRGEPIDWTPGTPVGEIVQPKAWTSTSLAPRVAQEFSEGDRVWDIRIPKGKKALVINPEQAEVVLPPNSQLRILRVDKWDDSLPGPKLYEEKVIAEVVDPSIASKAVDDVVHSADEAAKLPAKVKEAEKHTDKLQASLDDAIRARDDARAAMRDAADKVAAKREYLRKNRDVQKARKMLEASRGEASTARKAKAKADEIASPAPQPADPRLDESADSFSRRLKVSDDDRAVMKYDHEEHPNYHPITSMSDPVRQYTDASVPLNEALRRDWKNMPRELLEDLEFEIEDLRAMHRGLVDAVDELPYEMRVFRGEGRLEIARTPVKAGDVVEPVAWSSTSTRAWHAKTFADVSNDWDKMQSITAPGTGRLWDIRAPKGTKAIVTNADEGEVILSPNTRLQIVRIDKWDDSIPGPKQYSERVIAEIVPADEAAKLADDVVHSADDAAKLAVKAKEAEKHLEKALDDLDDALASGSADAAKAKKIAEAAQTEATDARIQADTVLPDTPKLAVADDLRLGESENEFLDRLNGGRVPKRDRGIRHREHGTYQSETGDETLRQYLDEKVSGPTGYRRLNSDMREGAELTAEQKSVVEHMTELAKPLDEDIRVFRGDISQTMKAVPLKEGEVLNPTGGFISTSTDIGAAREFAKSIDPDNPVGRVWDIRVPKGQKAIVTNADEMEVILPPNARVRIIRIDKGPARKGGYRERVIAEVVDADTAKAVKAAEDATPSPITAGSADAKKLEKIADEAADYEGKLSVDLDAAIRARDDARRELNAAPAADKIALKREYLRRNREVQKARKRLEAADSEAVDAQKHVIAPIAAREIDETSKTARVAGAREMDARTARNAAENDVQAELSKNTSAPTAYLRSGDPKDLDAWDPTDILRSDGELENFIASAPDMPSVLAPESAWYGDEALRSVTERLRGSQASRIVSAEEFAKGRNPVLIRGLGDADYLSANIDGSSAGLGVYGNGQYFAPLNASGQSYVKGWIGAAPKGHIYAARLADDAVVVTQSQMSAISRRMLQSSDLPDKVRQWLMEDLQGRVAALTGIDAIAIGDKIDDFSEIVVINRGKLLVDRRSLPDGEFYSAKNVSAESVAKQTEIQEQMKAIGARMGNASPERQKQLTQELGELAGEFGKLSGGIEEDWRIGVLDKMAEAVEGG